MPGESEPVVIGIDPSLTSTGICAQGLPGDLHFRVTPAKGIKGAKRLSSIAGALEQMLTVCNYYGLQPSLVAIEDLPKHAHSAGLTGQAQGVIRAVLADYEAPFTALAPATLKKVATGSGRADKEAMEVNTPPWLRERLRSEFKAASVNDLVDAWWLSECAKQYLGMGNHLAEPSALPELRLEQ